tara:strand:- start:9099 stop:9797 length:699 start_codon:yes stop_codon:yes gene_type:complete
MKAIILAGGLGERLRPLTLEKPKPLLPINEKPIMQLAIENLKSHGITDIILSIGYKADMIKDYFGDGSTLGVNISYNIEEELLGTGGAVKDIVNKFQINEDFILVWGDNINNFNVSEMKKIHDSHNGLITMSLTKREDVENWGVATLIGNKIVGFVEKPKREEASSNLINAGAFIINPKALENFSEGKSSIEKVCFEPLSKKGKIFAQFHKGYWFPTDNLEKYEFACKSLKN